jgi:hypothetical protein
MKTVLWMLTAILAVPAVDAQVVERQVIASAGSGVSGTLQVDWTIGETVVQSATAAGVLYQQGYHQAATQSGSGITSLSDMGIMLFPNPSTGLVFLQWEGMKESCTVQVYNMLGVAVHQQEWLPGRPFAMDLKSLSPGTYQVEVLGKLLHVQGKLVRL